jgi:hypothetical protein
MSRTRLVQHDQVRVGTCDVDLRGLGWTREDVLAQQAFLVGVIDAALAGEGLDRLPFRPGEVVVPALQQLRTMVAGLGAEQIPDAPGPWVPMPPELGQCEVHRVFLHEVGCIVCNDAPIDAPPDQRPRSTAHRR